MAFAARLERSPMGAMNTTPLIDVLLVLLVMFIITIPAATHSVDVELPSVPESDLPYPDTVKNKIVIDGRDRILWNGEAIDEVQLRELLAITIDMPIEPELQFEPTATASYATSARVLRQIKLSGVTKFGFVGHEKYREFTVGR